MNVYILHEPYSSNPIKGVYNNKIDAEEIKDLINGNSGSSHCSVEIIEMKVKK